MKNFFVKILSFFTGSSSDPAAFALYSQSSDDSRKTVYLSSDGGAAEYQNPSVGASSALGLDSAVIVYPETGQSTVTLNLVDKNGVTGIIASSDGEAASFFFSDIRLNVMPSEKILIQGSSESEFSANLHFRS